MQIKQKIAKPRVQSKREMININTAILGGQRELHKYLMEDGKMGIRTIWIAGSGSNGTQCLLLTVEWLGNVLKDGGLEGDLTEMGFEQVMCK